MTATPVSPPPTPVAGAILSPPIHSPDPAGHGEPEALTRRDLVIRWGAIVATLAIILAVPVPAGISPKSWRLLAIFLATIVGSIVRPLPAGAIVFLGVAAVALTGTLTPAQALGGYADPIVWLVLCAFFMSRGIVKTGLGRRIAFLFIRTIGHRSIGLAYALVGTDAVLASLVPSNGARAGGVVFPVARSLAEAYDSYPGPTRRRLGAFVMTTLYQCDVIACAMFLTGQASNVLIAKLAKDAAGVDLTYPRWFVAGVVPGVLSLLVVPLVLYRIFPPDVRRTPGAARFAADELARIGPMRRDERIMLAVFALVAAMWMATSWHHLNYAVVALAGICVLLLAGVLSWGEVISERGAWDVFIWYGGLVQMAAALSDTGITKRFAEVAAATTTGWVWSVALAALLLLYFYAHYAFASITAHATAMFTPFLVVTIAAGAPAGLAVLLLAFFSNLSASLTHYGTTPGPILFGGRYVTQREWWTHGLLSSFVTIGIYSTVGLLWWKILGWW